MKKTVLLFLICTQALLYTAAFSSAEASAISGKKEFMEHCAVCHPDGGNIVNAKKTLHKKDREMNNIKSAADIIGKIRNPGPGMTRFNKNTVSDAEARAIAKYILSTFK
jgi:cytochrome c6